MITNAPSASQLGGAVTWEPVVSSWLGSEYLGQVPVSSGSVVWSTGREVPGSVSLEVPRFDRGVSWWPGDDPRHPLARFGQTLDVAVKVGSVVSGQSWIVPMGRFLVTNWDDNGDTISVSGASMFQRIEDDRFVSPMATRSGGTLVSELRRVLPASVGLTVAAGLTNRAVPAMSWGESRMDAVREIAAAWPARLREDRAGNAVVLPPLPDVPAPTETLTDGEGGTVVSAYRTDTRDGAYNRVVARGQETTDSGLPAFQHVADMETGPMRVRGPYGVVTRFFSSPLITSRSAAAASARTMLADAVRPARTVPVILAPDPRWELDDAVEVVKGEDRVWGFVSGLQVPLTVGDGDMRLDVEVSTS